MKMVARKGASREFTRRDRPDCLTYETIGFNHTKTEVAARTRGGIHV